MNIDLHFPLFNFSASPSARTPPPPTVNTKLHCGLFFWAATQQVGAVYAGVDFIWNRFYSYVEIFKYLLIMKHLQTLKYFV